MADTALVELTSAEFTDLGALPVTVEHWKGPAVYLAIAASQPDAALFGHVLKPVCDDDPPDRVTLNPYSAGDTRHAWGRAHPRGIEVSAAFVQITGAP